MKARPSDTTAAATVIAVAPVRPAATVRAAPDGTTIARGAIVAAHPDREAAPHGPAVKVAGPRLARDRISAAAKAAIDALPRRRWWRLTSACGPKKRAWNPWHVRSRCPAGLIRYSTLRR